MTSWESTFTLFDQPFHVPVDVVRSWNIVTEVPSHFVINVLRDIHLNTHPHQFAFKAESTHAAARLGICVKIMVRGIEKTHWVVKKTDSAIPLADTIIDLLDGKIVGKGYI